MEEQSSGTNGGTFEAGDRRTRVLNVKRADADNIIALSDNQMTPIAGTYRCRIECPAYYVYSHQALLWNVTDDILVLPGTSRFSVAVSGSGYSDNPSIIVGPFTTDGTKVFQVQHECSATGYSYGFGVAANFGLVETYTIAEFWRNPT